MMSGLVSAIIAAISFGTPTERPELMRATKVEKFPRPHEEPIRPGTEMSPPAKKQRTFFGIGVGFERSGTLSGVALNIVLPDSPASRAGLVPGCVIAAINGEPTAGRSGEECARLISDGTVSVRIKYLDAALKEKMLVLEKQWLTRPE